MILQILADAAQRDLHGDPVRVEFLRVADPGQHQQLRRIDDAAAEDRLALAPAPPSCRPATYSTPATRLPSNTTRVASALVSTVRLRRDNAGCRYASAALQRRPLRDRHLPCGRSRPAARRCSRRSTAGRRPGPPPDRHRSTDPDSGTSPLPADRRRRDRHWRRLPATPAAGNRAIRAHRTSRQALGRPAIVVAAVAAHIGHGVDRRGAADHLAARALDAPPAEVRLGSVLYIQSWRRCCSSRPQPSGMRIHGSRSQPPASSTST